MGLCRFGTRERLIVAPAISSTRMPANLRRAMSSLAKHIDGARYVELPGHDHLFCAGEVLTSSVLRDLVAESGLHFRDRGIRALKGVSEGVRLLQWDRPQAGNYRREKSSLTSFGPLPVVVDQRSKPLE